jgi:serine protease AprX
MMRWVIAARGTVGIPKAGSWWRRWRGRSLAGIAAAAVVLGLPAMPASAGLLGGTGSTSSYIVADLNGVDASLATSVVNGVGGSVIEPLAVADAVLANLTPLEVSLLQAIPAVVVTPDVAVFVAGSPSGTHAPSGVFTRESGATSVWSGGDTGDGVNVAVLDTGIDPLPDFAGRLAGGVDLSGEGNPLHDSYGHGTFVAGLVAGNGASSAGEYSGEAPGAGLVAVKVAGATGQTDLATVIAGVSWAVSNRSAFDIGVLNMSLGYQPIASTALDPLDRAVDVAWNSGIVVVTSSGNAGPFNGTVLSPGDDPQVITVGGLDDMATPALADDTMAPFSSAGPTSPDGWYKPDLVASGRSVVSLRAPGSTIDTGFPSARIGSGNFVGSGTSFSAGITSGAVALILAAHPSDTPSQVKAALLAGTTRGPVGNPFVDGHGALSVANAIELAPVDLGQGALVPAVAMGGTVSLPVTWAASSWNPSNWSSLAWNGGPTSLAWNGSPLTSLAWNSLAWNGSDWNSLAWNGGAWNSLAWNGAGWNSLAWNGSSWNSLAWNGSAWNGASWNSLAWNGNGWNSLAWNGSQWG